MKSGKNPEILPKFLKSGKKREIGKTIGKSGSV
jgi:hypothetical protein